jgi:hypothetical protein
MAGKSPSQLSSTAQDYLDILDIASDMLILRDGSTSIILKVSAINFGLLSEPEQDAIIYAYAALINSLSFPIQILIKSKPKDVTNYLNYVDEQLQHAATDLRRAQIASYRQFVANLITEQNVLDKSFYVILPLSALELGLASAANPLSDLNPNKKPPTFDKNYVVDKSKNVLLPRRDHMINQFGRLGLRASHLDTKELIHLFYSTYNSESADGTRVVETRDYTSAVIQAQGALPSAPPAMPVAPVQAAEQATLAPTPIAQPEPVAPPAPVMPPVEAMAPVAPAAPVAQAPAYPMDVSNNMAAVPTNFQQTVSAIPQETAGTTPR